MRHEALHAPLDAPPVVRPCDDFLARVAALLKGNCAERIKIQHLRDELFRGCRVNLRLTACDIEGAPALSITSRRMLRISRADLQPTRRRIGNASQHRL